MINDIMDELEEETRVIMVNGEPKTLREVLDMLLSDGEDKKLRFSEG